MAQLTAKDRLFRRTFSAKARIHRGGPPGLDILSLSATAMTVTIDWNNTMNIVSTRIERKSHTKDWMEIKSLSQGINSYIDPAIPPETLYQYRLREEYLWGFSGYSTIKYITTGTPEVINNTDYNTLVTNAVEGTTLDLLEKMVLITGKRVNNVSKDLTIINGIFKRDAVVSDFLDESFVAPTNAIVAVDASGFQVNWLIDVVKGVAIGDTGDIANGKIDDITSNTITTENNFLRSMTAGDRIITSFELMAAHTQGKVVTFQHCVFDGNYRGNPYTLAWTDNFGMTVFDGHTVDECFFYDSPGEGLFVKEGATITNNFCIDLQGSFVHITNGSAPTVRTTIEGNKGDGICLAGLANNGHNEGVLTFSANSQKIDWNNNHFRNFTNGAYGDQSADDLDILVSGNLWEDGNKKIWNISGGHPDPVDYSGDTFINVPN